MNCNEVYQKWLSHVTEDEKKELLPLSEDEIKERFYCQLEFGTAGMRGILRLGTNGMNDYTVARATQGLALYMQTEGECCCRQGVVISYDSRHGSARFARITAQVLAANSIQVYLYDALRPVPLLSFGVRYNNAFAGVMITASHNPKEYNGYKVYGCDGAQLSLEPANKVLEQMNRLDYFGLKKADYADGIKSGLIKLMGQEIDDAYMKEITALVLHRDLLAALADELKIVYTPLHGTGRVPVMRVLKEIGLKNVELVAAQAEPDGAFPTVSTPNPENTESLAMAIEQAKKSGAGFVLGTDPDCDRMGVAILKERGEYIGLTGNQIGCLMLHYVLSQRKALGRLPENGAVIKTIVSTEMARVITESFGLELVEVLTGFKFIGEKIKQYEQDGSHTFLFGFEESYGYLEGTHARDKDGVVACMLMSETAAYYKSKGMTLYQGLHQLYEQYGYFKEKTLSYTLSGIEGMEKIAATMCALREKRPDQLDGLTISAIRDYQKGVVYHSSGLTEALTLPQSDVMYYQLDNHCWACVRPSGTEPKLKVYFGARAATENAADEIILQMEKGMKTLLTL